MRKASRKMSSASNPVWLEKYSQVWIAEAEFVSHGYRQSPRIVREIHHHVQCPFADAHFKRPNLPSVQPVYLKNSWAWPSSCFYFTQILAASTLLEKCWSVRATDFPALRLHVLSLWKLKRLFTTIGGVQRVINLASIKHQPRSLISEPSTLQTLHRTV